MNNLLSLLLIAISPFSWEITPSYFTNVTVENHVLSSVNDKTATYVRIYSSSEATSISEHAFDECSFTTLMISNSVRTINAEFPNTLTLIEYSGALDDISFAVPNNISVKEYACDEGFLNYWHEYIRPNFDGSICHVQKQHYVRMKTLYSQLDNGDAETILNTQDGTGTIKDSIAYLDSYFGNPNRSQMTEKEISQSVMITLILIIASFGMTSIGLFYFLKDKNVIK